jgi:hypothetical protein
MWAWKVGICKCAHGIRIVCIADVVSRIFGARGRTNCTL